MLITIILICVLTLYAAFITVAYLLQKQNLDNQDTLYKLSNSADATAIPITGQFETARSQSAIYSKADEAQRLHQTFQKFVPRQFVDHFAKGGADSLALGYADEDDVAVMFCDIRGFTRLSEKMSPQQLMNFLNSYFLRMNAPIHENGGFIDKFIGDAIMALFDHPQGTDAMKAGDAVKAALDLQKALKLYNQHRANSGYEAIKNGVGLHFGPVVLGTVGSDDRMDTTVIGDAVNIAQRIEGLTDHFGVDILASRSLVDAAIKELDFEYRVIDNILLKGKSSAVQVIEIYQHLDSSQRALKTASNAIIAEGITYRNQGNFKQALAAFEYGKEKFSCDKVFEHHINVCQKLMYEPKWDGFVRV